MATTEHIIAYLDILGFRKLVERSSVDPELQQNVLDILLQLKNGSSELMLQKHPPKITMFSDTYVLSYPVHRIVSPDPFIFPRLLYWTSEIQNRLLSLGYLIRGGITIGQLFHQDDVIFGQGLIDAYELEAKAKFPRVLLSESFLAEAQSITFHDEPISAFMKDPALGFIKKDNNNDIFLNYLPLYSLFAGAGHFTKNKEATTNCFKQVKEVIALNLRELSDGKPEYLEKWVWFGHYFNYVMRQYQGTEPEPIVGFLDLERFFDIVVSPFSIIEPE